MSDTTDSTPMSDDEQSEGMRNLRSAYEDASTELGALRKELAVTKLGVEPSETQMKALDALVEDWSDVDGVRSTYTDLFGEVSSTAAEPIISQGEPDVTGQIPSEAPAPPGGSMLENVNAATSGGTVPAGIEPEVDPVHAGYNEYHNDLASGRKREDAASQVLNRLIDRGAKGAPNGVYDPNEYRAKLDAGELETFQRARRVD